jgi:uncharacterized protein (DUF1810 family)
VIDDPYHLERFVRAQDAGEGYRRALAEIREGRKVTHWIWWIFPQLAGLGRSATSRGFSIASLDEARAYLAHPELGERLREATAAMLARTEKESGSILGPDDVKFHSSMTLFARAAPSERLFTDALERFFGGRPDDLTTQLLATTAAPRSE